jgi:hypothetical protein
MTKNRRERKNLVKRENFREKFPVRQNGENKNVTFLSPFFVSIMLTEECEKVLFPTCGKTCGECGKLKRYPQ